MERLTRLAVLAIYLVGGWAAPAMHRHSQHAEHTVADACESGKVVAACCCGHHELAEPIERPDGTAIVSTSSVDRPSLCPVCVAATLLGSVANDADLAVARCASWRRFAFGVTRNLSVVLASRRRVGHRLWFEFDFNSAANHCS